MFKTRIIPTNLYGLKYELELEGDCDFPPQTIQKGKQYRIGFHYSECNKRILRHLLDELLGKNRPVYILEIGVHYAAGGDPESSTIMMKDFVKQNQNAFYLGVDVNDKKYLEEQRFHTIKCSSSDFSAVYNKLEALGCESLDLIHIDGDHSVKQVWSDWQYASRLKSGSCAVLHDTNYHPGPSLIIDAIDQSLFDVTKFCEHDRDWGIAIARKY